jgi:SNF2 family DNA or RNA helicase
LHKLLCLEELNSYWHNQNIEPYAHQVKTAIKVIHEMGGKALLADEVGLGKTFEVGLIIKEYLHLKFVKKVLILTPASLTKQWKAELWEKFGLTSIISNETYHWHSQDIVIGSIDRAKRPEHQGIILEEPYDLVVVDEAHKLKNNKTANWQLINSIEKKFLLLLTATPIQNDLKELYNLISLFGNEHLGSYRSFQTNFVIDKRTPKNPEKLQAVLSHVMIRNTKEDLDFEWPKRKVHLLPVELAEDERKLYDGITSYIKEKYFEHLTMKKSILSLITLQKEVCSSSFAVRETLNKMLEGRTYQDQNLAYLWQLAQDIINNRKTETLINLIKGISDKVLIFTEYLPTQAYITQRLENENFKVCIFNGQMNINEKERAQQCFKNDHQVMVCTESGGEGLNLQHCNIIVNYDLPWNPMRVEQRIGRVHRLGQKRDVLVFNFSTFDTIEEYIVNLLHEKINMFEQVIGSLEVIIQSLDKKKKTFESQFIDIFVKSNSKEELQNQFNNLGYQLKGALNSYINQPITNLLG